MMSNSSRERVLRVWPDAYTCSDEGESSVFITLGPGRDLSKKCSTEAEAWDAAASKLSSPAGETPNDFLEELTRPLEHDFSPDPIPSSRGKLVPEPVPTALGTCADLPTTPHAKGSCESCDMWAPVPTGGAAERFRQAANTRCCDEWPECSHILAAYEEMVAHPSAPEAAAAGELTYDDCSLADAQAAEQWAVAYVCKVGVSRETMIDAVSTLRAQVVTYARRLEVAAPIAPAAQDELIDALMLIKEIASGARQEFRGKEIKNDTEALGIIWASSIAALQGANNAK